MVESPPLLRRTLARGGVVLLSVQLAGCFNPPAKDTDPTGDPATGDPATGDPATGDPATGAPTTGGPATADPTDTGPGDTSLATTPTTGEDPSTSTTQPGCECSPDSPYCTPIGCANCNDLGSSNQSCLDIDVDKPFCDQLSGLCVACNVDFPCAGGLLCHPESHTCVECVSNSDCDDPDDAHCEPASATCVPCDVDEDCSGFGPTAECDPDKHSCRGCAEHSDCPDTACDLAIGQCFPNGMTTHAYVDRILCGMMMDSPVCAENMPCCEIAQAFKPAIMDPLAHVVIHVKPGAYVSPVQVDVDGKRIAILGAPEGVSLLTGDPDLAAIGLVSGAPMSTALFVSRVDVLGPMATAGVLCSQSSGGLWFDDAAVRVIAGPGLFATECMLRARRLELVGNTIGAQASDGGKIRLETSVVTGSHGGFALQALSDGALGLLYTTVLDRDASANHLVNCNSEPLTLRNSILVTAFAGAIVPTCTIEQTNSAFSPDLVTDPMPLVTLAQVDFPDIFVDWMLDDVHLKATAGSVLTAARWLAGDPARDLDGDPRPAVDDSPDAAGAYLP